ncbi:MAG: 3-dehydroquinate synthase [Calditrichae bacterium]|nr:3-dehydroquinate synthase [Calditrichia bacterium]
MHTINVELKERSYPIYIGKNILTEFPDYLDNRIKGKQIAIVSSDKIYALYGEQLKDALPKDAEHITLTVPDGEKSKSAKYLEQLYTQLLENRFERNSLIIALGGGVIGDLAGYVAATFLRGIGLVQVPTTLLAQVDSSIGGKTGINHPLGKNLIGAFKQPAFVYSDINVLKTLPAAEIRCGLGEIIKYAFIGDPELFEFLEKNLDDALKGIPDVLEHLVQVSAAQKASVVSRDERESNLRMVLNFGHTFGHALEAEFGYSDLKHGEAVILGMKCALYYSKETGILKESEFKRGMDLLNRVPIELDREKLDENKLIERMYLDKKVAAKQIRVILLDRIGSYIIKNATDTDKIRQAFKILKEV